MSDAHKIKVQIAATREVNEAIKVLASRPTLAETVRGHFIYLHEACNGVDYDQHSDWIPGVVRAVADVAELDEDPEALASFAYLDGVADAYGLGIMGMLDAVLGEGTW